MRLLRFIFSRFFICLVFIAALIAAIIFLSVYIRSVLPAALAAVIFLALSVIAAVDISLTSSSADFKCLWLTVIIALPAAGALLYFISRADALKGHKQSSVCVPSHYSFYEYFEDGKAFLDKLIKCVYSAKKRIYLEFYIIAKGKVWSELYGGLERALKEGVEVKIICDGVGCALRAPLKDFKRLAKMGAKIKIFNRLVPVPSSRLNFRDHRKIAVIDGKSVFLGGVNIADEYAHITYPLAHWKDGGAMFTGEIAATFKDIFLNSFNGEKRLPAAAKEGKGTCCRVLADAPEGRDRACGDALAQMIYSAKERLYIFTPYLCTDEKLSDAIYCAAQRGIDVKIIIPHVPDKKLSYEVTKICGERFMQKGVEVFAYTPGFMHFKGVICDGCALLGSYNFDIRSMRLNYECGVLVEGDLCEDMAADFERCLEMSVPLRIKKHSAAGRLARSLLYMFAPLV